MGAGAFVMERPDQSSYCAPTSMISQGPAGPRRLGNPTLQSQHLLSLGQVLIATVRQLAEGGAVEPLGFFPLLSGAGGVSAAAGHAEAGNRLPHWCVAHLQVSTQAADDDNLVPGCSFFL